MKADTDNLTWNKPVPLEMKAWGVVVLTPWIIVLAFYCVKNLRLSTVEIMAFALLYTIVLYAWIILGSLLIRAYLKEEKKKNNLAREFRWGRWGIAVSLLIILMGFDGALFAAKGRYFLAWQTHWDSWCFLPPWASTATR